MMKHFQLLNESLKKLIVVYRHLADLVNREFETLSSTQAGGLAEINEAKEKIVMKIKELEVDWKQASQHLAKQWGVKASNPKLMDLAECAPQEEAKILLQTHEVLHLLVSEVAEVNKKNAQLVEKALEHVQGAMGAIRDTLSDHSTYKKQGKIDEQGKRASGKFVSKEV